MKSFLKKLILINLILLAALLSTKLVAYPYAYQRLYRPEDGRCIDLISDVHIPQKTRLSENKLISIIKILADETEETINVFIEMRLDIELEYKKKGFPHRSKFYEKLYETVKNKSALYFTYQQLISQPHQMLKIESLPNEVDGEVSELLYLAETNRLVRKILYYSTFTVAKTIGDLTKSIKEVIDCKTNPVLEYNLDERSKEFLSEKWYLYQENLKDFYICFFSEKTDMDYLSYFKSLKKNNAEKALLQEFNKFYLGPALDIPILLNLFSSPNKHSIVYAGGGHCERISKDLQQLGFKTIAKKGKYFFSKNPEYLQTT